MSFIKLIVLVFSMVFSLAVIGELSLAYFYRKENYVFDPKLFVKCTGLTAVGCIGYVVVMRLFNLI